MFWPTICVDNFLDNPQEIVDESKKLKFYSAEDGSWPGERTLTNDSPELNNFLIRKIATLLMPHSHDYKINASGQFQKITKRCGNHGWVHKDPDELTAIIYLSHHKNCGTSIYKPKSFKSKIINSKIKNKFYKDGVMTEEYKKALQENNNQFEETMYFESLFNRLVLFDSSQLHGVKNFEIVDDPRLTYIAFFELIIDPNKKSAIIESKKIQNL